MMHFDMDGKPVLSEEEKREEFAEMICQDCTIADEECDGSRPLECSIVKKALEHYEAWGPLTPWGHEINPLCPACGAVMSSKPIYDEEVGSLRCTGCGHTWKEMPKEWDGDEP